MNIRFLESISPKNHDNQLLVDKQLQKQITAGNTIDCVPQTKPFFLFDSQIPATNHFGPHLYPIRSNGQNWHSSGSVDH